jgi:hypothetical protein
VPLSSAAEGGFHLVEPILYTIEREFPEAQAACSDKRNMATVTVK